MTTEVNVLLAGKKKTRKVDAESDLPQSTSTNVNNNNNNNTKSTKSQVQVKKRNWACVIYPESAPKDWKDILSISGLQVAISPLHNKDLDESLDGSFKKEHYHIILVYGSPTTFKNVKSLTDKLNAPIPIALEQVRGYYRYLTHKDNPDKAQYNDKEILTLNGFAISNFVELDKSEVNAIKRDIQKVIKEKNITEYWDILEYSMYHLNDDYYDVVSNNTMFFTNTIRSFRHKQEKIRAGETVIDYATGEVINDCSKKEKFVSSNKEVDDDIV